MLFDIVKLWDTGGVELVLIAAFIYSQIFIIRYFIKQITAITEEKKEIIEKFTTTIDIYLKNLSDEIRRQEEIFQLLVLKINGNKK